MHSHNHLYNHTIPIGEEQSSVCLMRATCSGIPTTFPGSRQCWIPSKWPGWSVRLERTGQPASVCKSQQLAQGGQVAYHPSILGLSPHNWGTVKNWSAITWVVSVYCRLCSADRRSGTIWMSDKCSGLTLYIKGGMSRSRQENRLHVWTHVLPSIQVNAMKPFMCCHPSGPTGCAVDLYQ